ncbi:hypothetical protein MPSI1_001518 [Malassezia psittaci]|uniref:Uncharacterized protein n=1 Tax=Malassezia psittaci TaxID=1821823 RepID=A0AAF0JDP4_9BASI|nr:hypothetical protein MPSI1_001518 [Malassezia psittaci]
MSGAEPVPISDGSITLLLKYSQTTLFLTIAPSSMSVKQLKARILAVLAESHQPDDPELNIPFADAQPEHVEIYVANTDAQQESDTLQYTRLQDTKQLSKSAWAKDESPKLDAFALQDGVTLYLGFSGEPKVQIPSLDDEVMEAEETGVNL